MYRSPNLTRDGGDKKATLITVRNLWTVPKLSTVLPCSERAVNCTVENRANYTAVQRGL